MARHIYLSFEMYFDICSNHGKRKNSICFFVICNSSPDLLLGGTWKYLASEVRHLLQFGTSLTRAVGQDGMSPKHILHTSNVVTMKSSVYIFSMAYV